MKIKYLKACQEDGLTPEQIKEIEKIFDADKKRRKRDREERRKLGITIISLDGLRNDDPRSETMQIADPRVNVEQQVYSKRLKSIGIRYGSHVKVINKKERGGLIIQVEKKQIALSRNVASGISVEFEKKEYPEVM